MQTHYDLGIAYKEMGLTEEAIGEFEVALQHGEGPRVVDAYTMLGHCLLEKGDAEAAIGQFQSALAEPACGPEARKALSFEIGAALEAIGRVAEALEAYVAVQAQDPRFRDVGARVEKLSLEVTGGHRAAARAAQPLVKKGAPANGVPAAPAAPAAAPAAEGSASVPPQSDGRRNRKIGFV